jgi:hypothetical protein
MVDVSTKAQTPPLRCDDEVCERDRATRVSCDPQLSARKLSEASPASTKFWVNARRAFLRLGRFNER